MKLSQIKIILITCIIMFMLKLNMNAQIIKMYRTLNELKPSTNFTMLEQYYLYGKLMFKKNNYFQLFIEGDNGKSTLSMFRFTISTGEYKQSGNIITLTDTINDYTFKFKVDKNHRLVCIKGFKYLSDYMWKDVSYDYLKTPAEDYLDKNHELYISQGNNIKRLNNKDFNIKFSEINHIIGEFGKGLLSVKFIHDFKVGYFFKMYIHDVLFTTGTWKYKFGRIDLYDTFFKHTYYCYVKDDTSLYYINFPHIHSSIYEEDLLIKVH